MAKAEKAKAKQTLPPQTMIVLAVLIVILAFTLGYLGFYDPAVEENNNAQKAVAAKTNELDNLQAQEAEYEAYKKENERLVKQLEIVQQKIPSTTDELNRFLGSINQRARSSRVSKWTLFKQEGNIKKGEVDAVPIRMEFEATYEAALQFFWELASMGDSRDKDPNREQLINIKDVQISRQSTKADETVPMVKVLCVAETYLYTGGQPAQGGK